MLRLDLASSAAPVVREALAGATWNPRSDLPNRALARLRTRGGRPEICYRSESLVREYRIDDQAFDRFLAARNDEDERIQALRLLSRMRLVNSRNRLTHALLSTLVDQQETFLRTGDPANLRPVTQQRVVELLDTGQAGRGPQADPSRVSRLLRAGSVVIDQGAEVDLKRLCPSPREVHREIVRDIVRREQARMVAGEIPGPLTDHDLARDVERRCQHGVSRRSVAFIRQELGIPHHRARAQRGCYLTVTSGFSSLRPAVTDTVRAEVPAAPGVYEIRSDPPGPEYPIGRCPVIYLGSSKDLRKRLLDQVRGNGRNPRLAAHLAGGRTQVRWIVAREGWRELERRIYDQFAETFGAPPECNRMSP